MRPVWAVRRALNASWALRQRVPRASWDRRYVKLPAYVRGGVPLVWIVNIQQCQLDAYDRVPGPDEPGGTRYSPGEERPSVAGINVDISALLAELPLDVTR
jgi:hypothetical protein